MKNKWEVKKTTLHALVIRESTLKLDIYIRYVNIRANAKFLL